MTPSPRWRASTAAASSPDAADDTGASSADGSATNDDALEFVIARGQEDGSITTDVPVGWAEIYVFLTIGSGRLFSVHAGILDRDVGAQALALTIRAIRRTLAA